MIDRRAHKEVNDANWRKLWLLVAVVCVLGVFTGIAILGGRNVHPKTAADTKPARPPSVFNGSDFCEDEHERRKTFDFSRYEKAIFDVTFIQGCYIRLKTPLAWKGNWHAKVVDKSVCPAVYYSIGLNGKPLGPFDWCNDIDHHFSESFWVQTVQPNVHVKFVTDDPNIDP